MPWGEVSHVLCLAGSFPMHVLWASCPRKCVVQLRVLVLGCHEHCKTKGLHVLAGLLWVYAGKQPRCQVYVPQLPALAFDRFWHPHSIPKQTVRECQGYFLLLHSWSVDDTECFIVADVDVLVCTFCRSAE